jgi:hypothetical protein
MQVSWQLDRLAHRQRKTEKTPPIFRAILGNHILNVLFYGFDGLRVQLNIQNRSGVIGVALL